MGCLRGIYETLSRLNCFCEWLRETGSGIQGVGTAGITPELWYYTSYEAFGKGKQQFDDD
jgi:hypothetical protein